MFNKQELTSKKTLIEVIVICVVMGVGLLIYDYVQNRVYFDGSIERSEAGDGKKREDLELEFYDNKEELSVEVSDKRLSSSQVDEYFDQAQAEIDESYLGSNESANKVTEDLDLRGSYCDGMVKAYWSFDRTGVVSSDGALRVENIEKEGQIINLVAELSYENESRLYAFSVFVCRKGMDTVEGQLTAIQEEVICVDESSRNEDNLVLPKQVGDIPLVWKRKMNFRGLQILILGLVTVVAVSIGKKRDEAISKKQLIEEKDKDYPMIVSELSILMGAGMSFRKALERIVGRYNLKKQAGIIRPGYEDMAYTYRKICDGAGEIAALEDLGNRSESKEYRKLALLLVQNLRKGSTDLLNSLEKEEKYAFELRKEKAIRAGEEASTKLLIPMAGMLFIVIVILVVPALMQMNI
ncbi:MAG: type II secretion system F family protein [Pseudobutyrivibrio sp.]|nr:type II secretion system F family protein [Pseudobutyrivibrio sp.]